jgi:uncharacterized protein YqhQ
MLLLARSEEVQRVFEYHGAEHQTIAAREAGVDAVGAIKDFPRRHPRCGTAFLLLVVIISTAAHVLVGLHSMSVMIASRIVVLPLIVGITYEVLRFTSTRLDTWWAHALALPGLALQRITTRPASPDQIDVAVAALDAVVAADTQSLSTSR